MKNFVSIRLGKDSVNDIKKICTLPGGVLETPVEVDVTCTQIPSSLAKDNVAFIWLGSDNNKGAPTEWKQGFRALGIVDGVAKGAKYNDESTTKVRIVYTFPDSVSRLDFLQNAPNSYFCCSALPVIGLDDHSNQTIRNFDESEKLSDVRAFFYSLYCVYKSFYKDIVSFDPSFKDYFKFRHPISKKEYEITEEESVYQKIVFGAPGTGKSYSLKEDALASFGKIAYSKEQRIELFKQSKFIDAAKNYHTFIGKNILEDHGFDAYAEDSLAVLNKKLLELETLKKASKDDQTSYHNLNNRCSALKAYIKFAETIFVDSIERVTFHPNYSYAQFVGTYKPVSSGYSSDLTDEGTRQVVNILQNSSKSGQEKYDLLYDGFKSDGMLTRLPLLLGLYSDDTFSTKKKDGTAASGDNEVERNHGQAIRPYVTLGINEGISYKYVPGPFMRTLVKALNNPQKDFLLIIEEINRANVAAVFGDVFQLLDRKNGVSEYPIAASEDIKKYLQDQGIADCDELRIPSNMYIWATMNSADQGVFPMDTAFKRRWEFEYIGIDKNETWDYTIPLPNGESINWNVLRKAINGTLKKIASVNEDKLLGPYFLSKAVLEDANKWNSEQDSEEKQKAVEKFLNTFKSKVLMYLYEDVCKMRPGDVFKIKLEDGQTRLHYSDICDAFDKTGIEIFGFKKADIVEKYQQKKDN